MSIIAFIAAVAIPKFTVTIDKTNLVKIKSDIALIKEALNGYKNKKILSNSASYLSTLEEDNDLLFSKILKYPIKNSFENKAATWNKISNSEYLLRIDDKTEVKFYYDSSNLSFECDFKDENCKKLLQSY